MALRAHAETPLLPATCQRRPRACAHACSRQLPGLRAPGIHRPVGQARARCASSAAGSLSRVMFPCPWRAVGSAKIPPHRARVPRLAVGTQLDAQLPIRALRWSSQCFQRLSFRRCSWLPLPVTHVPPYATPQRRRNQKGSEVGRWEEQKSGLGPLGRARSRGTGRGQDERSA